ncbi:hypothetical protein BB558_003763 [Smittium angustum]|uniref:histone deacetylase n=1 Tax=Smittium angustum TaxID=133377 RepID=A0A2U1J584_SMIAN|nr:hypothetical protein BB558_003763 [Smittium angustum]
MSIAYSKVLNFPLNRHHPRVLYIDIDVHHGDGVEEAFYITDRVMTCSFHKYGEYFPGTGDLRDIGEGKGKYYSVNFPLKDGIDDESYSTVFEPVVKSIIEWYQPGAIVLQCGADSLSGDKLGCFNLSMDGHAKCVSFVKSCGLPTLVLGGGGYSIRNVSRAWAYETGILVGAEMDRSLPLNDYMDYYGPDYSLNVPSRNIENRNTREYLERIKTQVLMNLERTKFAPSVQIQSVPSTPMMDRDIDEERDLDADLETSKDVRATQAMKDSFVVGSNELYEFDAMGSRENISNEKFLGGNRLINEVTVSGEEQVVVKPLAYNSEGKSVSLPGESTDVDQTLPAKNQNIENETLLEDVQMDAEMDVDVLVEKEKNEENIQRNLPEQQNTMNELKVDDNVIEAKTALEFNESQDVVPVNDGQGISVRIESTETSNLNQGETTELTNQSLDKSTEIDSSKYNNDNFDKKVENVDTETQNINVNNNPKDVIFESNTLTEVGVNIQEDNEKETKTQISSENKTLLDKDIKTEPIKETLLTIDSVSDVVENFSGLEKRTEIVFNKNDDILMDVDDTIQPKNEQNEERSGLAMITNDKTNSEMDVISNSLEMKMYIEQNSTIQKDITQNDEKVSVNDEELVLGNVIKLDTFGSDNKDKNNL